MRYDFSELTPRQHLLIACGGMYSDAAECWPDISVYGPLFDRGWEEPDDEALPDDVNWIFLPEVRADWIAQRVEAFEAAPVPDSIGA